ncbi:hypothetical protein PSACC_00485 [Paramicrosporidium saccamoebae]|uniref:C2 domain-containing protein n=1 Tax=Paramicrosporidium saccamoebae TaxID=1246581 RepID=A0A2H9TPL3_9FUNG|nr:hypothetical protein PSACC_00485 [Paramicrosporidium saccamoebae]
MLAERQKWFREFEKVKTRPVPQDNLMLPCIGTVRVTVLSGKNIPCDMESYCSLDLNIQNTETRPVGGLNPIWNQSEVLCMASFDDVLRLSVFNYKKYAPNELLGFKDLSLDFLEYYNERSTEPMTVPVGSGSVTISFQYRQL